MRTLLLLFSITMLSACGGDDSKTSAEITHTDDNTIAKVRLDLTSQTMHNNEAAYTPPQCYTKTIDAQNKVHNPCFTCHQQSRRPNYTNDQDFQLSYDFPDYSLKNHWTNLFKDRTAEVAAISDEEIIQYVRTDNYQNAEGKLILAETLHNLPPEWDVSKDGVWDGYVPDCYFNFDPQGFDRDAQGYYSGWRAFGYNLFPGTFFPTNGSTDDVLIRLAPVFRNNAQGEFDLTVYQLNLAIVEAMIKERDIQIQPTDETLYGVDLNKDGTLSTATHIAYDWAPLEERYMSYVGQAKLNKEPIAAGLYPVGTEFLHSVRYIDIDDTGRIKLANRMKELRYGRKTVWQNYGDLEAFAAEEIREKDAFPDRLRLVKGNMETGLMTGMGWVYQGFIEDAEGDLRPQNYEEQVFCVACHSTMGAITDSTYAFPRKFDHQAFQHGWYHWTQKSLVGTPEPKREDGRYEYTHYLEQNGAADEFRANQEVMDNFFYPDGTLKENKIAALHDDVSLLLFPSPARARQLNKAYRVIVQEQSFIYGRDATITPPENVHSEVEAEQMTGVETVLTGSWQP